MRDGDLEAFGELYRRHAGAVRRYARLCCRDARGAEDLTDVVFLRTLQAVRGGTGPDSAIRTHLLTTLRRVAAAWATTTKRDLLVEDYAVFAGSAERTRDAHEDAYVPDADVRAMRGGEQSLAVRAFRSLPEPWQTVLWHTTVEKESADEVGLLLGLGPKATGVLVQRAREGLKQAYLQAHVNSSLLAGGDCARYADRLGAFARGALRGQAARGLREHVAMCPKCRTAALGVRDVDARLRTLLPVAVLGWSATGYATEATDIGTDSAAASPGTAGRSATGGPVASTVPAPRRDGTGAAPGARSENGRRAARAGEGGGGGTGMTPAEGSNSTPRAERTGNGTSSAHAGATDADLADGADAAHAADATYAAGIGAVAGAGADAHASWAGADAHTADAERDAETLDAADAERGAETLDAADAERGAEAWTDAEARGTADAGTGLGAAEAGADVGAEGRVGAEEFGRWGHAPLAMPEQAEPSSGTGTPADSDADARGRRDDADGSGPCDDARAIGSGNPAHDAPVGARVETGAREAAEIADDENSGSVAPGWFGLSAGATSLAGSHTESAAWSEERRGTGIGEAVPRDSAGTDTVDSARADASSDVPDSDLDSDSGDDGARGVDAKTLAAAVTAPDGSTPADAGARTGSGSRGGKGVHAGRRKGLSARAKIAIGAVAAIVATTTVLAVTVGNGEPEEETRARPSASAPAEPQDPDEGLTPQPPGDTAQRPGSGRDADRDPDVEPGRQDPSLPGESGPSAQSIGDDPGSAQSGPGTGSGPWPGSSTRPPSGPGVSAPVPPGSTTPYRLSQLSYDVSGDGSRPEVRAAASSWLWQRDGQRIDGTRYAHGASMHANSSVTIELNRSCVAYDALVGVDDGTLLGLGSVRFSVYGDGVRLWRSSSMRSGDSATPVHVPLSGRKSLRLVVEGRSLLGTVALADWAQSSITCR
ncbi:NPCBM/NEW2 domain-containing protein [Streptomyces sp. NPDC048639]|uniref:NPCBM/NEW2 domain-containing protein n=1 Tax=Streptomyces sp. NPDC048639 TaxID=3365581 RepID=UPI0037185FAC